MSRIQPMRAGHSDSDLIRRSHPLDMAPETQRGVDYAIKACEAVTALGVGLWLSALNAEDSNLSHSLENLSSAGSFESVFTTSTCYTAKSLVRDLLAMAPPAESNRRYIL